MVEPFVAGSSYAKHIKCDRKTGMGQWRLLSPFSLYLLLTRS